MKCSEEEEKCLAEAFMTTEESSQTAKGRKREGEKVRSCSSKSSRVLVKLDFQREAKNLRAIRTGVCEGEF